LNYELTGLPYFNALSKHFSVGAEIGLQAPGFYVALVYLLVLFNDAFANSVFIHCHAGFYQVKLTLQLTVSHSSRHGLEPLEGLLIYLLTPWFRILFEKLIFTQLVKKILPYRWLITVFTQAHHWTLS
jgi:hypothetical protein